MRNVKSKRFAGDDSDDESWNPRARVGPVAPKTDRPIREGAKRPAVERVLEAAAQKRAFEPVRRNEKALSNCVLNATTIIKSNNCCFSY